ncbi:hypothetical protein V8C37DRAFT_379286 [Trichoderma ceciliae]
MRFTVALAMMVGLAVAMPKTPLDKRQCSTQPVGCCVNAGHCDTCYFGDEPFPCNCDCFEPCPCTEIHNTAEGPVCVGWSATTHGTC